MELAQRVQDALQRGERAVSFSTPTFGSAADALVLPEGVSLRLTPAAGLSELREIAEAEFFDKWKGLGGYVAITAGAKAACFSVLRAVTKPGDRVLIIAPAWPSYEDICHAAGAVPIMLETDAASDFCIETDALKCAMKVHKPRVIIVTSPNNPTGRIYSAAEITTLHEVARHSGAALVIDESFSKINFDMRTWQSAVLGDLEQAVIINSFSKNFHLQGLRLGSMLAKPTLLDKIVTVHQAIVSSAPSASQHLAIQYFKRHGPRIPEYCQQRELAISFAERSGWSFTAPQGTFYIFPRLADVAAFVDAARAHCIYVLVGTAFGSSYVDHVRFCFGKPLAELEEMLCALGGASNAA